MFSKLAIFFAAFMAVFVVALPRPGGSEGITDSCNGGQVYCCNSVQSADSEAAQKEIILAGILAPISAAVGLTCDPISALALAGNTCTSQQTCCTGNNYNGAIVLGCDNTKLSPPVPAVPAPEPHDT